MPDAKVISSRDQVRLLAQAPRRAQFRLDIPDLTQSENAELESELREALNACGCLEAAAGLALGLVVDLGLWLVLPTPSMLYLIAVPILMMVAGKKFGQWRGRNALRRLIRQVAP